MTGEEGGASDLVLALSTAPDAEQAERIARALVEERLIACANSAGASSPRNCGPLGVIRARKWIPFTCGTDFFLAFCDQEPWLSPRPLAAPSANASGQISMTRPLCRFPTFARYIGGNPLVASSFVCSAT